jgi:hypothetical protein
MRTPSTAGSPTTVLASRAHAAPRPPRPGAARHDGAADGGALLAGLDRHLARHLLDEEVELLVVGRHLRRQDGAVQRVGLGVEGMLWRTTFGCTRSLRRGVGRAGEGDHVAAVEAIQQVAGAADHQLQRAGRQDAGLVDQRTIASVR